MSFSSTWVSKLRCSIDDDAFILVINVLTNSSLIGKAVVSLALCKPLIVLYCVIKEVTISGKFASLFLLQSRCKNVSEILEIFPPVTALMILYFLSDFMIGLSSIKTKSRFFKIDCSIKCHHEPHQ